MIRLFLIAIALIASVNLTAADNASEVLSRAARKIRGMESLTASCIITGNGAAEHVHLTMSGKSFLIKAPGYEVWYDGKNQWTYSNQTDEVSLTEPDKQELAQINPLSVIDYFIENYNAASGSVSKGTKQVILTAKKRSNDIVRADILLSNTTDLPLGADLYFANGAKISITVSDIKSGKKIAPSVFRYDKKLHPHAEIIDLR